MRNALLLPMLLWAMALAAQPLEPPPAVALGYSRTVTVPLNPLRLHDAATEAWTWTFGREPGAKVLHTDRATGTIKGTARINFRSAMLTGREETMGTISFLVHIQAQAGSCRISVTDIAHTGNRNTARGGIHLGQLMRDDTHAARTSGMSRSNVIRLHRELREAADARIQSLIKAFEARLRAGTEP